MKPHFSERELKVLDLRENQERREAERQKALLNEYTGFSREELDFFFEGLRWYQRQLRAELPEVAETYLAIEALKKKLVAMMYRETL